MRYVEHRSHGCDICRGGFGWETKEIPDHFEAAEQVLRAGAWSRHFHRCRRCQAWWAITWNPKDMLYEGTAAPASVEAALRREATLDAAWPFLFGPAPIDEIFENYLYAGHFDPVTALNRLLDTFSDADASDANRADILRMLSRLLALRNPEHAALQRRQGWVWPTPTAQRYTQPLLKFEREVLYRNEGYRRYGMEDMKSLRWVLERDASGQQRIFRDGTPAL